ncbi:MAG: BamA/TamA family outer membrane protein [candidate division Zixibacteria bacterium]|nr:BamA/TamA family outer membrane protein [candidate division Zixibacteria bacterium]
MVKFIIQISIVFALMIPDCVFAMEFFVDGNSVINSKKLINELQRIDFKATADSTSKLKSRIIEIYQKEGYWDIQFDNVRVTGDSVFFDIREGRICNYYDIGLRGNAVFETGVLLEEVGKLDGKTASKANLESYINRLLEYYSVNGMPYARITPDGFKIDDRIKGVSLDLIISEGPEVEIDTVIIEGNKTTGDRIIRRELLLRPGMEFNQFKLAQSVRRINNLGFVEVKGKPGLYYDNLPSEAILKLTVEEIKSSYINGIFGYVPAVGSRDDYITGLLDITLDNIMGTGRKANVYYSAPDPDSRELLFSYTEPYFLGMPLDWTVTFNQVDRDSTYVRVSAEIALRYRLGINTDFNLYVDAQRTTPGAENIYPEERFTGYSISPGLSGNYFDDRRNPKSGYAYDLIVRYIKRIYESFGDYIPEEPEVNRTAVEFKSGIALKIFSSNVLYFEGGAMAVTTNGMFLPVSERYDAGGRKTVRGYLEGRYYGSTVGFLRSEYRLLTGRSGRIFLFGDNGYYYFRDRDGSKVEDFITGFGFGAASQTRVGMVTAQFAWGEGDSFGDGKFYFGIENRF